ncbi:hypothetical protein MADA3029_900019 [Vibrio nigripulchritudo MADA3029]|nr:hypothetical protein VIBNIMADA3020_1220018 [Vibrio nigripulchritudo MADA3020]CCN51713.1 hypothetical protein VIBNIMADA3021_1160018 [Vibrio nigripulchritudo MADA3021]CCN61877.1 hypothetical protein MADA3029_900019 [Vibrio nigripulchritudo MADA3029]
MACFPSQSCEEMRSGSLSIKTQTELGGDLILASNALRYQTRETAGGKTEEKSFEKINVFVFVGSANPVGGMVWKPIQYDSGCNPY